MPISFLRSAAAVEKMCKVLKVSSSGYYYWRKHPVGARQLKQTQLLADIRRIHTQSQSRYGSPRITDELRERGVKASRNRVARLMHKAAIRSIMYKKYRVQTTDSSHHYPVAKNLLNREFTANKPGQKWVSDITYIPTQEGWLYLTAVLDLADRKVIGWALSDNLKAVDTSVAAWRMALNNRSIEGQLLLHRSGDPVRSRRSVCLHRISGSVKGFASRTKHEPQRQLLG